MVILVTIIGVSILAIAIIQAIDAENKARRSKLALKTYYENKIIKLKQQQEKKELDELIKGNLEISRKKINDEILLFAESINKRDYEIGYTGPFGLRCGQLKTQIQVNKNKVEQIDLEDHGDAFVNILPPKTYPLFDNYIGEFNSTGELICASGIRFRYCEDYNLLINEMRAAFDKAREMIAKNYGNGSINLIDTYEIYQQEVPELGIDIFNSKVANGHITCKGFINSTNKFANDHRFIKEDLYSIKIELEGREDEGMFGAYLRLYFIFNNFKDDPVTKRHSPASPESITEKAKLLDESF